jgi:hypothetical protein
MAFGPTIASWGSSGSLAAPAIAAMSRSSTSRMEERLSRPACVTVSARQMNLGRIDRCASVIPADTAGIGGRHQFVGGRWAPNA